MRIGKYSITLKNIKSFIVGKSKYLLDKFGPKFLQQPTHIREQIVFRYSKVPAECKGEGGCKECGCPMHQKVYSPEPCKNGCYGPFLNKEFWEVYKKR